ncbi:MAG: HAD hydrolase family protein [Clostridia bacterium]|nr:HAD hydrolase family protein [Clostridia bacterium]
MKDKFRIPVPGQRIVRTAIAVGLCLAIYVLRGKQGIPLFSALAAMQSIQPYTKDMKGVARKRILGTAIGALWGLSLRMGELAMFGRGMNDSLHYFAVSLLLIPMLHSTVLMKLSDMTYFSAVVYISVTVGHFGDTYPDLFLFVFNRMLDTVIGVAVAAVVNRVHLPRRQNTDTLFVSALGHSLLGNDSRLSPYSLVELNRLMDDGAKVTISTVETQATVRELLPGVKLRYPIITMDGAALYDMGKLEYIRTVRMSEEKADRMMRKLTECGVPYFSNNIEQNLLVIRYAELANEGMRRLFEKKRSSPYRNYVKSSAHFTENVMYLLAIDTVERIDACYEELMKQPWIGEYSVVKSESPVEGWSAIKIYDGACSREAMLKELEKIMGTSKTITFGCNEKFDVVVKNADRNELVKQIKRRFEPVDLKCWKRIFRW